MPRLASRKVSSWTTLLVISLCLIFLQPLVYAQEVTIAPSTASSLTTTPTSTPSASPSSSPLLVPTLPFNTTLPPLNASNPSVQINLPASSTLYVTLNICGVSANSSILPRAIISTSSPPNFILGRTVADPDLGGLQVPNQVNRDGDPTLVSFNKGFGNWTWNNPDLTVQPSLLLALGIDNNGDIDSSSIPSDNGDVVVHVGVSSTGESMKHARLPWSLQS
jgi:calcium channel MID1